MKQESVFITLSDFVAEEQRLLGHFKFFMRGRFDRTMSCNGWRKIVTLWEMLADSGLRDDEISSIFTKLIDGWHVGTDRGDGKEANREDSGSDVLENDAKKGPSMRLSFTFKNYTLRKEDGGNVAVIDDMDADYDAGRKGEEIDVEIGSWCDDGKHEEMSKLIGHEIRKLKHRQRFNGKKLRITIESMED